jgi:hypothetical protein
MAITYPLTPPPALTRLAGYSLTLKRAVAFTASPFTMQQQLYDWGGALWTAELDLVPVMRAGGGAALEAFITALRGRAGTFLFGPPHGKAALGTCNQTGVTVSGAGQAGFALTVTGLGASTTVLAGTYLSVGLRLHQVVEGATASASGTATLTIEPGLRASPSNGAAVKLANPQGLFRLASEAKIGIGMGGLYQSTNLSIIEAL